MSPLIRRASFLLVFILLRMTAAHAQMASPEDIAHAYLEADLNGSVLDAAKLVHPDAREAIGSALLELAEEVNDQLPFSPIPPEEADDYEGLSPAEAYEQYYSSVDEQRQAFSTPGHPVTYEIEPLGSVVKNDIIYVIFRTYMNGVSTAKSFKVVILRSSTDGWGVWPEEDMQTLIGLAPQLAEYAAALSDIAASDAGVAARTGIPSYVDFRNDCADQEDRDDVVVYIDEKQSNASALESIDPAAIAHAEGYTCADLLVQCQG